MEGSQQEAGVCAPGKLQPMGTGEHGPSSQESRSLGGSQGQAGRAKTADREGGHVEVRDRPSQTAAMPGTGSRPPQTWPDLSPDLGPS